MAFVDRAAFDAFFVEIHACLQGAVVPAEAGTHTARDDWLSMGPGVRRNDEGSSG
jgi:hypothetical protein